MNIQELLNKPVTELTDEEFAKIAAYKRDKKQKAENKRDAELNKTKEKLVTEICNNALQLQKHLIEFKKAAIERVTSFKEEFQDKHKLRKNSKGTYSFRNEDKTMKVTYQRRTVVEFSHEAQEGEMLIREVLTSMVKKNNQELFGIIEDLLGKDSNGNYDPSKITILLSHENDIQNPNWSIGLNLLKKSITRRETAYNLVFHVKSEIGAEIPISLDFGKMQID